MTESETRLNILQAELDAANARNERLIQENARLREQLVRIDEDERSKHIISVEDRLKAFQFENERDRMNENLEKLKRKYNQLHDAFLLKLKRCKALEEVFHRQKTLTGLVMKSPIAQRDKEQTVLMENRQSSLKDESTIEVLQNQVAALQRELAESYDIIDEMDFELESIDLLEMENQRLREKLSTLEKQKTEIDSAQRQTDSTASSLADSFAGDMDAETLERAALTESLIKVAEVESNCLRRELLRFRLQKTIQAVRPTSSDA